MFNGSILGVSKKSDKTAYTSSTGSKNYEETNLLGNCLAGNDIGKDVNAKQRQIFKDYLEHFPNLDLGLC